MQAQQAEAELEVSKGEGAQKGGAVAAVAPPSKADAPGDTSAPAIADTKKEDVAASLAPIAAKVEVGTPEAKRETVDKSKETPKDSAKDKKEGGGKGDKAPKKDAKEDKAASKSKVRCSA